MGGVSAQQAGRLEILLGSVTKTRRHKGAEVERAASNGD
jgi:hypothetical protein